MAHQTAEFREVLHQLPDAVKVWMQALGSLETVQSLDIENEILRDYASEDGQLWQKWKLGKHQTFAVTFPHESGGITFTKRFVKLGDTLYPDEPFQQATHSFMSIDPSDREAIRQFLLKFAEHIVNNVSCEDLDRLEMQEIIERIPDMPLLQE